MRNKQNYGNEKECNKSPFWKDYELEHAAKWNDTDRMESASFKTLATKYLISGPNDIFNVQTYAD